MFARGQPIPSTIPPLNAWDFGPLTASKVENLEETSEAAQNGYMDSTEEAPEESSSNMAQGCPKDP